MSIGYTWEKLYGAVLALVHSDSTLQDRVASAYRAMHMLTREDFPDEELQEKYARLVQAWRPDQARAIAETLLRLYTEITRREEQHYRSLSSRDL